MSETSNIKIKCRFCNELAIVVADWTSEGFLEWSVPLCEKHAMAYELNQQLHGWIVPTFTKVEEFIQKLLLLADVGNEKAEALLKEWGVIQ